MRCGWCALLLTAGVLATGPAQAEATLTVTPVERLVLLAFGSDAGSPEVVSIAKNAIVIDTRAELPLEALWQLGKARGLVSGATVEGSRLRLTLGPDVAATSQPLQDGGFNLVLEETEPIADAPAATAQVSPRTIPQQLPRPATAVEVANPPTPPKPAIVPERPAAIPLPAPRPTPAAAVPEPESMPHQEAMPHRDAAPSPDGVEVTATATDDGADLAFAWPAPVRAAVFQRGDTLWAAFDGKADVLHGPEAPHGSRLAAWLEPLPPTTVDGAQVFRFRLNRAARVEVVQDGRKWRVRLSPVGPAADAAVGLVRDQKVGALRGAAPARALDLTDPDTGERLGALLAAGDDLRQPTPVRLVDLELLPAAQGLAWVPVADGITVATDGNGFTLSRDGGLRLSASVEGAAPRVQPPSFPLTRPSTLLDGDPEAPNLRRHLAGLAATIGLADSAAVLGDAAAASQVAGEPDILRQRLVAAGRAGDWTAVAGTAQALLDRHAAGTPIPEEDVGAVVWLALAHARQGELAAATALPGRYAGRLPEGPWRALLGLVAAAAPEPAHGQAALPAAEALVSAVRRRLDEFASPGGT